MGSTESPPSTGYIKITKTRFFGFLSSKCTEMRLGPGFFPDISGEIAGSQTPSWLNGTAQGYEVEYPSVKKLSLYTKHLFN